MRRAVLPVYRSAIVLAKRLESRGPSDLIRLIREVRFFELFVELSGSLTECASPKDTPSCRRPQFGPLLAESAKLVPCQDHDLGLVYGATTQTGPRCRELTRAYTGFCKRT